MGVRRVLIILLNILVILCLLALIGLTIYGFVKYREINTLTDSYFTIAFGIMLGVMGLIILVAICGICLSNSDSRCCCVIYCILTLTLSVFLIGIGIAALLLPPVILGDNCTSNSYYVDLQRFTELSQTSICFTCPCYFPSSVILATYTPEQIALLTPMIPLASSVDSTLPVQAQGCTGWDTTNLTGATGLMNFLEKTFQCTGWCTNTSSLFYRFTNVSNGIPKDSCYDSLKSNMGPISRAISIPTIIIGGLLLLSFLIFSCICWVDKDVPERMYDNGMSQYQMNRMPQLTAQQLRSDMTGTFNPSPHMYKNGFY